MTETIISFPDDVKLLLAKEGLCETIYKLLEKYKTLASTSEARALMKLACDLIVLILTGGRRVNRWYLTIDSNLKIGYLIADESMHYLYSTPLLKNMEDWLDSYDIDLLTTGVLALGNFARTDSHCIDMVENKIMNKLLGKYYQNKRFFIVTYRNVSQFSWAFCKLKEKCIKKMLIKAPSLKIN